MKEIVENFENLLEEQPIVNEPETVEESLFPTQKEVQEEISNDEEKKEELEVSPLYSFLQAKGIKDPSKVQFENEDGTIEELDFNSLSAEEQLEILNQVSDPGLSDNEKNAINYLRKNGDVSLEQVVEHFAQKRLEEYLNENPESVHKRVYSIDDYTDDDLYIIDLKQRYPDFTDEELLSKLENAKENDELFKREAANIRSAYKAQEDKAEADRIQQEKQQVEDLRNNLMIAANNFNEVQLDYKDEQSDSLVIEETDKQQMLSYILDGDSEGKSQLVRDLENPDTLIELAWLRTKGADMLSDLTRYWKKLLADERSTNKKLQSQIDKLGKKNVSSVIVPQDPSKKQNKVEESVWDKSGLI